jgi:TetR/AcrR family fatty acid metabolism transcriptional regulator
MAPRGDRSTTTRDSLLRAAAEVFIRRGPYGATMREIAEQAGVTVPAVYYHFEGRDQLYDTLVCEGRSRFLRMAEEAIAARADAELRLRRLARAYVQFGREDPVRLRLLCMELFGPREPEAPDRGASELRAWIAAHLDGLVADVLGVDSETSQLAARLFTALMHGLLVEQARDPETTMLDDGLADRAVDAFLHGMGGVRERKRSAGGGRA